MGSKVWSATDYSLRPSSHFSPSLSSGNDSLLPLLDLWERRHLTRGALRNYTGDIELDQPWRISGCISSPGARALFSGFALHVFLLALCDVVFFEFAGGSIFPPKNPRVARTLQAEETGWKPSQLDCPKVGGTRQAEETGSRCFHLHQVGEDFLNSEVASEVPAVLPAGRVGGTRRETRAHAEDIFGEAFATALTTTIYYGNTPGLRAEGRWQCRARLCRRWFF